MAMRSLWLTSGMTEMFEEKLKWIRRAINSKDGHQVVFDDQENV
jgi:hypothetical protein